MEKSVQNTESEGSDADCCPDGHKWSPWDSAKIPDRIAIQETRHCSHPECRYIQRREVKWIPQGGNHRADH